MGDNLKNLTSFFFKTKSDDTTLQKFSFSSIPFSQKKTKTKKSYSCCRTLFFCYSYKKEKKKETNNCLFLLSWVLSLEENDVRSQQWISIGATPTCKNKKKIYMHVEVWRFPHYFALCSGENNLVVLPLHVHLKSSKHLHLTEIQILWIFDWCWKTKKKFSTWMERVLRKTDMHYESLVKLLTKKNN